MDEKILNIVGLIFLYNQLVIQKLSSLLFLFGLFLIIACTRVAAGGGPIQIDVGKNYGVVGEKVPATATLYTDNQDNVVTGRKAEFKIKNARKGDICVTTANISDGQGKIYGECYAAEAGKLEIYVYWFDRELNSSSVFIDFVATKKSAAAAPVSASNLPKSQPSVSPIATLVPATIEPTALPESTVAPAASDDQALVKEKEAGFFSKLKQGIQNWFSQLWGRIFSSANKDVTSDDAATILEPSPTPLDTTAPVLAEPLFSVEKPTFKQSTVCFTPKFTDDRSTSLSMRFAVNDKPLSEWAPVKEYCLDNLSDATYTLKLEVKDEAENSASAAAQFVVQTGLNVSLSGTVYYDQNCNYQRDAGEVGLTDQTVHILESTQDTSQFAAQIKTNAQGGYSFSKKIKLADSLVVMPNVFGTEYVLVTMSGYPKKVVLSSSQPSAQQNIPLIKVGETSKCN